MPEGEPGQLHSVHPPCSNRDFFTVPAGSVSEVQREMSPVDSEADTGSVVGRGIVTARRAIAVRRHVVRPGVLVVVHVASVVDISVVVVVVGSRSIRVVTMAGPVAMIGSSPRGERDTESRHDSETQQ